MTLLEAAEHEALGAACTLRWPDGVTSTGGDPNFPLKSVPLTARSYKGMSYELTFNKVVPIAGDFFTTFDYLPRRKRERCNIEGAKDHDERPFSASSRPVGTRCGRDRGPGN